jgi:Mg-chelatase subunit ChlD
MTDDFVLGGLIGLDQALEGVGGLGTIGTGSGGSGAAFGLVGVGRRARAPEIPTPTVPVLDPNGRFATTYRPGRGHLAWLDDALARGELPPTTRELVAAVGDTEAPPLPTPVGQALALRADLERAALPPAGGPTHLRIALRSAAGPVPRRPPLAVHVVLDVSGSMEGAPLAHARAAVEALVARLWPGDQLSLTTFSWNASVVLPAGPVGPRRARIAAALAALRAGGGTALAAGLARGYAEAARGEVGPDWVRLVLLLSDGRPTEGEDRASVLGVMAAEAFAGGVETSAFGVGPDHDGALMAAVAARGAGGYYYLPDADRIAPAMAAEIEGRLRPVAQAVEVRVRLAPGVRLVGVPGSRRLDRTEAAEVRAQELAVDAQAARRGLARDRAVDAPGGMRFFIPGFSGDDHHALLLALELPGGVGDRLVAEIELRYKDRLRRRNVTVGTVVHARHADSDAESAQSRDPSVAAAAQAFAAGEALLEAAQRIERGDDAGAAAVLAERVGILRCAAKALAHPALRESADRLERLRALVGDPRRDDPLMLARLLDTSGQGLLR